MARSVGLRTEIIFHITLLLGAALLCGGFLLLKLTERELLAQRVDNVTATMEIVGRTIGSSLVAESTQGIDSQISPAKLLHLLPDTKSVHVWQQLDNQIIPLYSHYSKKAPNEPDVAQPRLRFLVEPQVFLAYSGTWAFGSGAGDSFLEVAVPLRNSAGFRGILQARFSLEDVADRVWGAQKLLLLYVFFYGTILFLFGVYLLNRNVVRPINGLMETTRLVAEGHLEQTVPENGPREIASLARSFNTMVAALADSRRNTEAHICSLQQTNDKLQQTRTALTRSEKMASVGHLAAGMAHEIGNPLGAVVGYLELLKTELPHGREQEIARRASEEAGRIDKLVQELLDYAMPGKLKTEIFDPVEVLEDALELLSSQGVFHRLHLVRDFPSSMPLVSMVRHQLLQVFVNLLLNACDASSADQTICVQGKVEGAKIRITVEDQGQGINAENLEHVFDPFFTTKAPGKGRGLGLAVCYRIIDEAGGCIEAVSVDGSGSSFTVCLPIQRDEVYAG